MTSELDGRERRHGSIGGRAGLLLVCLGMFGGPILAPIIGLIGSTVPLGTGASETMIDWSVRYLPAVKAAVGDFVRRGSSGELSAGLLVGHIAAEAACVTIILAVLVVFAITRNRRPALDRGAEKWVKATTSLWSLPAYGVLALSLPLVVHNLAMDGSLYDAFFDLAPKRRASLFGWLPVYALLSTCGFVILNFAYLAGVVGVWSTLIASYDKARDWLHAKSATG